MIILAGLVIVIIGLLLGLRNIRPASMTVICGIVIAIGTVFGLFGKQIQDLRSSEKSDSILKTGEVTKEKIESLTTLNSELKTKADSLDTKLEIQAQTIDKLRQENTELYFKLSESQLSILKNTERSLQPLSITDLSVTLSYNFDNANIASVKSYLFDLKSKIEQECAKYPRAVNGTRKIPTIPDVVFFPTEDNKITTTLIVQNQHMLNEINFHCPNIGFQFFSKYPTETRSKQSDGTYLVKKDVEASLELVSQEDYAKNYIQLISLDLTKQKINLIIALKNWIFLKNDGTLLSFKDLFEKFLKVSSYYNNWQKNEQKFEILAAKIINDKKTLQFEFNKEDKSKSAVEFNTAFIKQIKQDNFLK